MIHKIFLCLILSMILITSTVSCSDKNPDEETSMGITSMKETEHTKPSEQIDYSPKSIKDSKSWIEATVPLDGQTDVNSESNISVKFKYDMDESSLNGKNIIISEGKHSSTITGLYNFNYDKATKTLHITFKLPGNSVGTSNGINILVTHKVKNIQGEEMGIDVIFGYSTM